MTYSEDVKRLVSNQDLQPGNGSFQPGELIGGKYRVLELIGKGGMGCVYKVSQVFLNKEYALKTLNLANVSDTNLRRFQAEAKLASMMVHPSLVQVHDFGLLINGYPYLVMDFVDGISLADFLKENGPLPEQVSVEIITQACLALLYAHNSGVVHRDLKPNNIMLSNLVPLGAEGSIRVVDFGIAKLLHTDEGELQALTKTGEIFGSPLYMSPEQCSGGAVDHRADIYSLGCVLFEMLTGTPPHFGQNAMTTMLLHLSETAPTLKQASLGKEFAPSIEKTLAKMLCRHPGQRYQNLRDVMADLVLSTDGGAAKNIVTTANQSKRTSDTVTIHKRDLAFLLVLTVALTALVTALVTFFACRPPAIDKSSTVSARLQEYSPELGMASKAVTHQIKESELTISELRSKINSPMADGKIRFRGVNFDRDALKEISKSKEISTLDIIGCGVDNSNLDLLKEMPRLVAVTATKTNLTDEGTAGLAKCVHLKRLKLSRTPVGDVGAERISKIKTLEALDLSATNITDKGVSELAGLKRLKELNLSDNKITADSLNQPGFNGLEQLIVDNINLKDAALTYISRMSNLKTLSLCGASVTAQGVDRLLNLTNIKMIYLADCRNLQPADFEWLSKRHASVQLLTTRSNDIVGFSTILLDPEDTKPERLH